MRRLNNTISSEHFTDGIVYLYPLKSNGEPDEGGEIKRFYGERNMTYKRIMEARQIMTEYSRIICVPLTGAGCYGSIRCAKICGRLYRVETVQEIVSAFPPAAVLALSDWNVDSFV